MSGRVELMIRLKDISAPLKYLEMTVELLAENRRGGRYFLALSRTRGLIHGSAHGGVYIVLVNLSVAACARTRPDVSHAGLCVEVGDILAGQARYRGEERN